MLRSSSADSRKGRTIASNSAAGIDVSELTDSLGEEIPAMLSDRKLPGLAIGVCDASTIRWSNGFGVVGAGQDHPVETSTIFSIQSASKMYTATAVMLAVQQGLVELDEPVTTYLPDFTVNSRFESEPERKITLRHLLSHTAGFTHEAPVGGNFEVGRGSFEAHCRSISETWLRFPVGHHFEYSNLGVDLAGYILQRRSGVPFHEFVRRELLAPLGLPRTTFDHRVVARESNRAIGHGGGGRRLPVRVPMVPAGAVYTSVDEALRFLQFHLRGGEDLLDAGRLQEMYRIPLPAPGQQTGFGLGSIIARWDHGILTRGHGGGGFGFVCELNWVPDCGIGVVVLTNSSTQSLHVDLSQRIFSELCARSEPENTPLPPPAAASEKVVDGFVADYVGGRGGVAKVIRDDGRVAVEFAGGRHAARVVAADQIVLEEGPVASGRRLFGPKPRERFRFLPGDDGRPRYMQSMEDGYVRYRNEPLPGDGLVPFEAAWLGEYRIRSFGMARTTVELRNDDGRPVLVSGRGDHESVTPLGQHRPGIYFTPEGEALDLTRTPPTYANIKLFRPKAPPGRRVAQRRR